MSGNPATLSHFPVRISAWTPKRFFDAAAGLPPSPATTQWLQAGFEQAWANPIGRHGLAARSRATLDQARAQFASVLSCKPSEVWFAPSTELALQIAFRAVIGSTSTALVSEVERLILLRTADALAATGLQVDTAPVTGTGQIDFSDPNPTADWAVVQAANRETGIKQDLGAVRSWLAPRSRLFVDATAIRSAVDVPEIWDVIVLDPGQWGGPPGVSVVGCRESVRWVSPWPFEDGEGGRFPVATVALAAAAVMSWPSTSADRAEESRLAQITDEMAIWFSQRVSEVDVLGRSDQRLGNVLSTSFLYVNAEQLVDDLARSGFSVHSGSACTSDTLRPSHVLTAMGALTSGNLRISLPPGCPTEEVEELLTVIATLVGEQRRAAGF